MEKRVVPLIRAIGLAAASLWALAPSLLELARNGTPQVAPTLLAAGANAKAKSPRGLTAFDYAKLNPEVRDTDVCWKLDDAQY